MKLDIGRVKDEMSEHAVGQQQFAKMCHILLGSGTLTPLLKASAEFFEQRVQNFFAGLKMWVVLATCISFWIVLFTGNSVWLTLGYWLAAIFAIELLCHFVLYCARRGVFVRKPKILALTEAHAMRLQKLRQVQPVLVSGGETREFMTKLFEDVMHQSANGYYLVVKYLGSAFCFQLSSTQDD